jgi:ABC-type uncharacterized transport system permease subunit
MPGNLTLYYTALAFLAAAAAAGVVRFIAGEAVPAWIHRSLGVAGVVLQTAYIGTICRDTGEQHLFNSEGHKALVAAWACALGSVTADVVMSVPAIGAAVMPGAALLALAARFMPFANLTPSVEFARDSRFLLHVLTVFPAYGMLFTGALTGVIYLLTEHALKRKSAGWLLCRLPPLSRLERAVGFSLLAGFALFTVAIVLGTAIVATPAGAGDPKLISSAAAWAVIAAVCGLRVMGRLRGRRVVWLTVAVFAAVAVQAVLVGHPMAGVR